MPGGAQQPGTAVPGTAMPGGAVPGGAAPAGGRRPDAKPLPSAWRARADGSKVFQLTAPLVGWWAWLAFAVLCLGDLAVQGRDRAALQTAVAVVVITGFVYACAFRPKVIADDTGITVQNPIRDYRVPWAAIKGIFLGDSVEVLCAWPGRKSERTVYSWALYTRRRARARAKVRAQAWDRRGASATRPAGYGRLPKQAQEAVKMVAAEVMARELGRLREAAVAPGAGAGPGAGTGAGPGAGPDAGPGAGPGAGTAYGRWAWLPLAAMLIPSIGLVLVIVIS